MAMSAASSMRASSPASFEPAQFLDHTTVGCQSDLRRQLGPLPVAEVVRLGGDGRVAGGDIDEVLADGQRAVLTDEDLSIDVRLLQLLSGTLEVPPVGGKDETIRGDHGPAVGSGETRQPGEVAVVAHEHRLVAEHLQLGAYGIDAVDEASMLGRSALTATPVPPAWRARSRDVRARRSCRWRPVRRRWCAATARERWGWRCALR